MADRSGDLMADWSTSMPCGQDDLMKSPHVRALAFLRYKASLRSGKPSSFEDIVMELKAELSKTEEKRLLFKQEMERYKEEHQMDLHNKLLARLRDFDPKQGGVYYNRFHDVHLASFNLDEESPLGPMRFTNAVYKCRDDYELSNGVNIFSVKISCSDVGFPIHVYGTVIARDNIDCKCVYLFRRDGDHCQTINSKDESLVLTGPKRGLALFDYVYIETDLKIKDHQGNNTQFSKGLLSIRGVGRQFKCEAETISLATRLSTVDVVHECVSNAVEGTIAIRCSRGYFDGEITACTTSTQNKIVLYDRELYGTMTRDGEGVFQLMRPVVCVCVKDKLVIVAKTRDGRFEGTISFTPGVNGGEEGYISVGTIEIRVKVTWSIMDF